MSATQPEGPHLMSADFGFFLFEESCVPSGFGAISVLGSALRPEIASTWGMLRDWIM